MKEKDGRKTSMDGLMWKSNAAIKRGVDGKEDNEFAMRAVATPLSPVGAPPPVLWPDGRPESLRSLRIGCTRELNHYF
ncbi:hypothetical protein PoB_003877800 [Plakobranchus ocellatus]|uniref:Uncharacterized protein n=1 Tax=Plakobranchus ocellatus TaxID=259542 RepID=A0AAV4AZI4_9GAST|nr:hypothetical protein PoB_003877800 [Plakobranchus ocellatus]